MTDHNDIDEMKIDDLRDFAKELDALLLERDNEVADLHKELNINAKNRKKGGGGDVGNAMRDSSLEVELEEVRTKLENEQLETTTLRDALADLKARCKSLEDEAKQAKIMEKSQSETCDQLKKEIAEKTATSKTEKTKASQYSKQRSDAMEESRRQHSENTQLQEEVRVTRVTRAFFV